MSGAPRHRIPLRALATKSIALALQSALKGVEPVDEGASIKNPKPKLGGLVTNCDYRKAHCAFNDSGSAKVAGLVAVGRMATPFETQCKQPSPR